MKINNTSFLFLALAFAKAGDAANDAFKLAYTVPWSPSNSTSVDQGTIYNGTYYLADRVNNGVHVVNLSSGKQNTIITGFKGLITANGKANNGVSGPDGVLILPNRNELYVGDGDGSVKVIDLFTNKIVANISTGSHHRADEMAYDAKTGTVVVTVPNDEPPKVAVISVADKKVTGTISFNNASGLEQPAFNSVDGRFYISVPGTGANPGGEIAVIDTTALRITHTFPLSQCVPAGIVFGPNQNLFIGCSQDQILNYGVAYSQVMDISAGHIIANISGIAGIDQVAYDPKGNFYFASAYQNLAGGKKTGDPMPQLAVINAQTNSLVQTWATDNVTAHSVATDPETHQVVVPLKNFGIAVYNLTGTTTSGSPTSSSSPSASSSPKQTNSGSTLGGYSAIAWIGSLLLGGALL